MPTIPFGDKERMSDLLSGEKYLASLYCEAVTESSTEVRQTFRTMLNETHAMQFEVWNEMSSRGWYPTESAEMNKIDQEKQNYSSDVCATCR
jgi:spore coat protein CotF